MGLGTPDREPTAYQPAETTFKRAFFHFQNTTDFKQTHPPTLLQNFQRKIWGMLSKSLKPMTSFKNPHY